MVDNRIKIIQELFYACIELNPEERAKYLKDKCNDLSIIDEVKSLFNSLGNNPNSLDISFPTTFSHSALVENIIVIEPQTQPDLPFDKIGEYKLIRFLGEGGMGIVFEAEHTTQGHHVALKILKSKHTGSENFSHPSESESMKFQLEAETCGNQEHPGIVKIHSIEKYDGIHYIVQELVEGGRTLAHRLRELQNERDLPKYYFRDVAKLLIEVAGALEYAHASGVIHRDIKPSNILLTQSGKPKVTDFGLAIIENAFALSRTDSLEGTPYYMSPEQAMVRRLTVDHRTDIYSLGVTLYELITLKRPFEGKTSNEILKKIIHREPKDPRKVNPSIPRNLAIICLNAMQKNPGDRYQSMKDFSLDIRKSLKGIPILPRPIGWIRKSYSIIRRNKLASIILAVLFCGYIIINIPSNIRQYKQIDEVLVWTEPGSFKRLVDSWCYTVDPTDPCSYIYSALHDIELNGVSIDSKYLESAQVSLEQCLLSCNEINYNILIKDIHYLLSYINYHLAIHYSEDSEKKHKHLQKAEIELNKSKVSYIDSLLQNINHKSYSFIWRYNNDDQWYNKPILLYRDHYLASIFNGINTFQPLYIGGFLSSFTTSKSLLEKALKEQPNNAISLTVLGRLLLFYARYYNQYSILDEAEDYLNRAAEITDNKPYHMIFTTLGQIRLLRGDLDQALVYFKKALHLFKTYNLPNLRNTHGHNIFCGLGSVYLRQGRYEEALNEYNKALLIDSNDCHVNASLGFLYLLKDDLTEAMKYAMRAMQHVGPFGEREILYAGAHLLLARVCIEQNNYSDAMDALSTMINKCEYSPRDYGLSCLLLMTVIKLDDGCKEEWCNFDNNYSVTVNLNTRSIKSPICLSALGTIELFKGNYQMAILHFDNAISERTKWPEDVKDYYETDNARDLYLQALAYFKIARDSNDDSDRSKGIGYLIEAEKIYQKRIIKNQFIEYADILERIRSLAAILHTRDIPRISWSDQVIFA